MNYQILGKSIFGPKKHLNFLKLNFVLEYQIIKTNFMIFTIFPILNKEDSRIFFDEQNVTHTWSTFFKAKGEEDFNPGWVIIDGN